MTVYAFLLLFVAILGCDPSGDTGKPHRDSDTDAGGDSAEDTDTIEDTGDPCPDGVICVDTLPFTHAGDTSTSHARDLDGYACAPGTDESGPEVVYRVLLQERGALGVSIDDSTAGVDVDAHVLTDLDPSTCLDRGNHDAHAAFDAGYAWVVADTYDGDAQAGPYSITIGVAGLSRGDCAMETDSVDRVGDGGDALEMPATGPLVLEAHLVTVDDGYGTSASGDWPESSEERISAHYGTSQNATGFVMWRDQPWAPQEGCEYGQGASGAKLPVEDEGWYVNMYWRERPAGGTRMIVRNGGRVVVVAAGYETGPGDLDNVGGATEEVHAWLGTGHGGSVELGFAVDQSLPLGPRECE